MYVAVTAKSLTDDDNMFELAHCSEVATLVLQSLFGSLYILKPVLSTSKDGVLMVSI